MRRLLVDVTPAAARRAVACTVCCCLAAGAWAGALAATRGAAWDVGTDGWPVRPAADAEPPVPLRTGVLAACVGLPVWCAAVAVVSVRRLVRAESTESAVEREDAEYLAARRPLTEAEALGVSVLAGATRVVCPWLSDLWAGRATRYTTGKTRRTLGVYDNGWGRPPRGEAVYLAEGVFAGRFGYALAAYLHEHAHVFGTDGSRRFTDALTELIEGVVTDRRHLDVWESAWDEARRRVTAERLDAPDPEAAPPVPAWLAAAKSFVWGSDRSG